jgi:hypothetical protein
MSLPNSFPHGYQVSYNIVSGGHALDAPTDQSGTCRVIDPLRHGADVDPFQMPYVTMLRSPTQSSPGNFSIMELIQKLAALSTNKNRPTQFQETQDKGAPVRAITQEFGDWTNMLTKGLPTHAALAPMAGQVMPAIKEIETAISQFASILGGGSLGQIPGSNMNMGSMLKNLNVNQKKKITENMPLEIQDALNSTLELLMEGQGGSTYLTSRVDEETFKENAVDLLSQCASLGDLMTCLQELRSNTALHGLDKLEDIVITTPSAYGNVTYTMDHTGKMKQDPVNAQQILSLIQNVVGMLGSLPGAKEGESMFREDAAKVAELAGRIPEGARVFAMLNGGLEKAMERAISHQGLGVGGPVAWAAKAFKVNLG